MVGDIPVQVVEIVCNSQRGSQDSIFSIVSAPMMTVSQAHVRRLTELSWRVIIFQSFLVGNFPVEVVGVMCNSRLGSQNSIFLNVSAPIMTVSQAHMED